MRCAQLGDANTEKKSSGTIKLSQSINKNHCKTENGPRVDSFCKNISKSKRDLPINMSKGVRKKNHAKMFYDIA